MSLLFFYSLLLVQVLVSWGATENQLNLQLLCCWYWHDSGVCLYGLTSSVSHEVHGHTPYLGTLLASCVLPLTQSPPSPLLLLLLFLLLLFLLYYHLLFLQSGVTFLVGALGTSILCMSIPYTTEMLPAKITTFAVFSSVMGATIAPLVLLGGQYITSVLLFADSISMSSSSSFVSYRFFTSCLFLNLFFLFPVGPLVARAAMYTAGVVGGLSLTAACAPSEKYLYMSGPLSIGLGVVVVASIGQYMHVCLSVCMYVCMYVQCVYVCMYVCVYVCMYVCV